MIIGITGEKRSGKDTAASVLKEKKFIQYRFADPLKDACRSIFLWGDEHIEGDLKEVIDPRWGISPRQAMQYIGTEVGREALSESFPDFKNKTGDNIWVNRFKYWYDYLPSGANVVIPDVRFLNEARAIKETGGIVIKIIRPSLKNKDSHSSEKEINKIPHDHLLMNDSTLDVFLYRVRILVYTLMGV